MVEMLNVSYDWGTTCWDRSEAFFLSYNMFLQNGHVGSSIDVIERVIETFNDNIFRGRQRPTKKFFDSFKLDLDVRAQYLGNSTKLRRRKAGAHIEGSLFRDKGKPNNYSLYTK